MIRSATLDDARAIAEVHVKSWQAAYRGLLPQEFLQSLSVDRREQQWQTSIVNREHVLLVYELESVVAFCSFAPTRDDDLDKTKVAELGTMYALESVWGQGIGRKLWHAATTQMCERGFSEVMLWVLRGNEHAIKFYERMGLTFDGKTKTETRQNGLALHELRYHMKV
jgi:RimJ/RimL family protein N-acetyltransferase